MILRRLTLAFALLAAAGAPLRAQSSSDVMSLEDVVVLLQAPQVSREVLGSMVRTGCVSFPLDGAAVSQLRSAGADDAFISVVRGACFTGAELVVQSQPSGAEVLVDGRKVGTTPWTGRYAHPRSVQVVVRRGGRSLNGTAALQPRQRVRTSFAFHEDTVAVPRARSSSEVAQELRLEARWRPAVPAPDEPGPLNLFTGNFLTTTFTLGTTAAGVAYCHSALNQCFIPPLYDYDGADAMQPVRWVAGGVAGLVVGNTVTGILQRGINWGKRSSHERRATARHEWERSNQTARAEWVRSHPDLRRKLEENRTAREQAMQRNQQIRARNQATRPVQVTTEPLPGPAAS